MCLKVISQELFKTSITEKASQMAHIDYSCQWVKHYNDVIISSLASQFASLTIVYSTVYSGADQRKHQSSASPVTGEFPAQRASNAENVSIWLRHHLNLHNVIRDDIPQSLGNSQGAFESLRRYRIRMMASQITGNSTVCPTVFAG